MVVQEKYLYILKSVQRKNTCINNHQINIRLTRIIKYLSTQKIYNSDYETVICIPEKVNTNILTIICLTLKLFAHIKYINNKFYKYLIC